MKLTLIEKIIYKLTIALFLSLASCNGYDDADYKKGVNYIYDNGQLEFLFTYNAGEFGNHYYFYNNGMIRAICDKTKKYFLYDKNGNLTSTMKYSLLEKKSSYKYTTLDSSCTLEIYNNKYELFINCKKYEFSPLPEYSTFGNEYSLILKKNHLEIHLYKNLDDQCIAIYKLYKN